jgi:nitric oxide dioxygenase
VVILYEETGADDQPGQHHDLVGRITAETLGTHLKEHDADFYCCGPPGFMSAMEATLDQFAVPADRRHSEVFGPDPSFAIQEIPDLVGA